MGVQPTGRELSYNLAVEYGTKQSSYFNLGMPKIPASASYFSLNFNKVQNFVKVKEAPRIIKVFARLFREWEK